MKLSKDINFFQIQIKNKFESKFSETEIIVKMKDTSRLVETLSKHAYLPFAEIF